MYIYIYLYIYIYKMLNKESEMSCNLGKIIETLQRVVECSLERKTTCSESELCIYMLDDIMERHIGTCTEIDDIEKDAILKYVDLLYFCLLYTSPSPRDS